MTYDGMGRVTHVWNPGWDKTSHPAQPNLKFEYTIRSSGGPSAVVTSKLVGAITGTGPEYTTSSTIYDARLRQRQVQTQASGGGRSVTYVNYDSRGLKTVDAPAFAPGDGLLPNTTLYNPAQNPGNPPQTRYTYDGAERESVAAFIDTSGVEKWRTTTSYSGDRVNVVPPAGGTPTSTLADVRGNRTAIRQYASAANIGSDDTATFHATTYTYTPRDALATITDPHGNDWTYTYDLRGRKTVAKDPDKGTSTLTIDAAGQVTRTVDARSQTISTSYDLLGRTTATYSGTVATGTKLTEYTYDTLPGGKGLPVATKRIASAQTYTTSTLGYDPAGRPTGSTVTIPNDGTGLNGTYTTKALSYTVDGQPLRTQLPATDWDMDTDTSPDGQPDPEVVTSYYDGTGKPDGLTSSFLISGYDSILVRTLSYNALGQVSQRRLSGLNKPVIITHDYDTDTTRLNRVRVNFDTTPDDIESYEYTYDPTGNVTRIKNLAKLGTTPTADHQCYTYDYKRRLKNAWTPTSGTCATAPTVAGIGTAATAYWHAYDYDSIGNRKKETQYKVSGNTVRTYTYPATGVDNPRPHALVTVSLKRPRFSAALIRAAARG